MAVSGSQLTAAQQQAAAQLAAYRAQQAATNAQFLNYALEKPVSGATPNGETFSSSGPNSLKFQISGINGAWLRRVRVVTTGTINYTANATSPTCTINAAGLDALYSGVKQSYGSSYKPTVRPIYFSILKSMRGYGRLPYSVEPSVSQNISAIQAAISSSSTLYPPGSAFAAGANAFLHTMDVPLQALHPGHPSGILPVDTTGTVYTLELIPNLSGLIGSDPLDNLVNTNGKITLSGCAVVVTFFYSDGESVSLTQNLQPDMTAMPSAEYAEVTDQPLVANQTVVQQLQLALPLARLITIVIDGVSSSQFAQVGTPLLPTQGVTKYALLKGSNKTDAFVSYDSSNGSVTNYYTDYRDRYGSDLPAGVFVYDAIAAHTVNPSNQNGLAYFDTSDGVWASARIGVEVGAIGANGNPRIVTQAIVQNPAGIIK